MKAELKLRGVETRLRLFKGENHELSRKGRPRNRAGRLLELLELLERMDGHLKTQRAVSFDGGGRI